MSILFGNDLFVITCFGICIFIFSYFMSDKIIAFLHKKSLGSREEIIDLMDKMFIEVDKKRMTLLLLFLSFGVGSLLFLLLWPNIILGTLIGGAVTILSWSLPKVVISHLWNKRCDRVVNQMVDGMTIMANGVKAGLSTTQSMERVIENITGPLSQEFKLILNKIRLGMTLEDALIEFGERIPRQDVQMFVTSVNILKETGGNLAETFQTITSTVRDRQKIEKKIQALTAQGIMQGVIITLVPFVILIIFTVIDPGYVKPLFTTPLGWFALFIMLALQIIGGVMMKKVVTIKV